MSIIMTAAPTMTAAGEQRQYKSKEGPTITQACVMMDKSIKYHMQRLAELKHTTLSYLVNVAAEEYLRRYIESRQKESVITI